MPQEKDKVLLKHPVALNLLMFTDGKSIKKDPLKRKLRSCCRALFKTKEFLKISWEQFTTTLHQSME